MIEYTGSISYVRFYSEETKFIVASFECDQEEKTITITGNMSYVNTEERYRLKGDYVVHPRYGKQFKIQSYEVILADDHEQIVRYLSSPVFKGVGKKMAENIVNSLGDQCLTLIKDDPHVLYQVKGLPQSKANMIADVLKNQDYDQEVLNFFMGHGISTRYLSTIQSVYQDKTLDVIKANPYQLIDDIEGFGFKSADAIAKSISFDPLSIYRIKAAITDAITQSCFRSGAVYTSHDEIKRIFYRLIKEVSAETFEEALDELLQEGKVVLEEDRYYSRELYDSEVTIASLFKKFSQMGKGHYDDQELTERIHEVEAELGIKYDDTQAQAIKSFMNEPALILTGGPGTGKTTVVQGILKVYKSFHPDRKIDLLAPTGRSAKRLSELTHMEASTIHRSLGFDLTKGTYARNADYPLESEMLVIDEFSMVDSLLFAKLLQAGSHVHKILMIGDEQQLPPVSPGNVLRDLMASEQVPVISLNTIYRQSAGSGIVKLAHAIANDMYTPDLLKNDDVHFIECLSYEVIGHIIDIVKEYLADGYDINEIQVLAPMYNGVAGIDAINEAIQSIANPSSVDKDELKAGRRIFRVNDKVLQLKNRVDDNVFNGDIGTIVEINRKDNAAYMSDTITIDFDGILLDYPSTDFNQLTHAYCMSVHKSQGNEFPIVIMSVLSDYYVMMRKNLLYTGLTRAKQKLFLIGSQHVFEQGIRRIGDLKRKTTLTDRLKEDKEEIRLADFM